MVRTSLYTMTEFCGFALGVEGVTAAPQHMQLRRAPATPGVYPFRWRMLREGEEWFGDLTPPDGMAVLTPMELEGEDGG